MPRHREINTARGICRQLGAPIPSGPDERSKAWRERALLEPSAERLVRCNVQRRRLGVRYAWPSELDLMARLAGLRLRHRWSTWDGGQYTASSQMHVSVYERSPE